MCNAALNTHVQVIIWIYIFISLGLKPSCGLLGHMVSVSLTLENSLAVSYEMVLSSLYLHPKMYGNSSYSGSLPTLGILASLMGVCNAWYFIVVLICFPQIDDVDIFLCAYWAFVYLL